MTKSIAMTGYFNISGLNNEQSVLATNLHDVLTFSLSERYKQMNQEAEIKRMKLKK